MNVVTKVCLCFEFSYDTFEYFLRKMVQWCMSNGGNLKKTTFFEE